LEDRAHVNDRVPALLKLAYFGRHAASLGRLDEDLVDRQRDPIEQEQPDQQQEQCDHRGDAGCCAAGEERGEHGCGAGHHAEDARYGHAGVAVAVGQADHPGHGGVVDPGVGRTHD
jgi:hypothetical protein